MEDKSTIIAYKRGKVNSLGMELDGWEYESCQATCGVGEDFATIYSIDSSDPNKGHATILIKIMRKIYTDEGKRFGTSVALSPQMQHLVKKLELLEYKD